MGNINIIVLAIIAATAVTSLKGFSDPVFFERYKFNISAIINKKQWDRLITSAFLHGDIFHLFFNMYTFYFFSEFVLSFGMLFFFVTYIGAILGGNLLSLWMHRKNPYYSAIGASGGVSGILFASIILDSTISVGIFPFPFSIPGWVFGIVYLGYSVYGMKTQLGNIGHDAHLGGAVIGLLSALGFIFLYPDNPWIRFNPIYLGLMILPLLALAYLAYKEK